VTGEGEGKCTACYLFLGVTGRKRKRRAPFDEQKFIPELEGNARATDFELKTATGRGRGDEAEDRIVEGDAN